MVRMTALSAEKNTASELPAGDEPLKLLIVDDDELFLRQLARAMERRGFLVFTATDLAGALTLAAREEPQFAVVDLKLDRENGLDLVPELRRVRADMRIVILTGYGAIASAVAAIKTGAVDYLAKPADADAIEGALLAPPDGLPPPPDKPMTPDRVRWEHIQRIYEQCNRNVSETARRLNMHRRTLQRILAKRAPR